MAPPGPLLTARDAQAARWPRSPARLLISSATLLTVPLSPPLAARPATPCATVMPSDTSLRNSGEFRIACTEARARFSPSFPSLTPVR
jgi:hypothetical protein